MYAVYAFCREADDAVDEGGSREEKAAALDRLRRGLDGCFAGTPDGAMFRALAAVARRYGLDRRHLAHVLDGCAMDLDTARYETFADLGRYLDAVASAVGRITMQIFGIDPEKYADYAIAGGYAVQITNILRDVKEDHARDRIYIPHEDLRRFNVPEADLGAAAPTLAFRKLMEFEVARNREYYAKAKATLPERERRRLLPLTAITKIYARLLDRIERAGYDVLSQRIAVPGWRKAAIGLGAWARAKLRLPLGA